MTQSRSGRPRWHAEYLDALRGIAVLAVLVVHAGVNCALPQPWGNIVYSGQRGVQLFFVVSAFTLWMSSDNRRTVESRPTRNFFLRRLLRIAPMYYVAILLTIFLSPAIAGSAHDLTLGFLLLQGLSPEAIYHVAPGAWTVADEALFYLVLPLFFRTVKSLRSALVLFFTAAPVLAGLSLLLQAHHRADKDFFAFFWFPIELPVFTLGIAAYFFWRDILRDRFHPQTRPAKRLSLLLLAAFGVVYALNLPLDNRKLYLTALACVLLLLALALHPWRLLVNPVTIFLGRISFSVYLLHAWPLFFVERHTTGPHFATTSPVILFALRLFGTSLPTVLAATLTWRFIEEPGIALGRHLIRRLERNPLKPPQKNARAGETLASALHASTPEEQF